MPDTTGTLGLSIGVPAVSAGSATKIRDGKARSIRQRPLATLAGYTAMQLRNLRLRPLLKI